MAVNDVFDRSLRLMVQCYEFAFMLAEAIFLRFKLQNLQFDQ